MKCVKKGDEVKRMWEDKASKLVDQGWAYCSKSEWKKSGKIVVKEEVVEKKEKKSKNKKAKKEKKADANTETVEVKTENKV